MNFIINRWVRGEDFHGRDELLEAIHARRGKPTWVLGNRRVGKTSLLRQVEWLCRQQTWPDTLGLYWDLQGAGSTEGLKDAFLEALEDNEDLADSLGIDIDSLESFNFVEMLNKFRRKVKALKDKHLILLIDECEELVDVAKEEPAILAPFRKLSQSTQSLTIVMAGSYRMNDLDESDSRTSLFLPDFLPPLLLRPFTESVAVNLLQSHGLAEAAAQLIYKLTLGNPHLLQVLGEHVHRTENVETALAELKHHKVAHYYFQSNFQCLPEAFRHCWKDKLALQTILGMAANDPRLPYLEQSALIRREGDINHAAPLIYMEEANTPIPQVIEIAQDGAKAAQAPQPTAVPSVTDNAPSSPQADSQATFLKIVKDYKPNAETTHSDFQSLSAKDDPQAYHAALDHACPELILGTPFSQTTTVYLAGLAFYRHAMGRAPFSEIEEPYERADAIANRDVVLSRSDIASSDLNSKEAMILLRCLKADPKLRYPNIEALKADLSN